MLLNLVFPTFLSIALLESIFYIFKDLLSPTTVILVRRYLHSFIFLFFSIKFQNISIRLLFHKLIPKLYKDDISNDIYHAFVIFILLIFFLFILILLLFFIVNQDFFIYEESKNLDLFYLFNNSLSIFLNYLFLVILASISEEFFFRFTLFYYLREKNSFVFSSFISSFLFSLGHLNMLYSFYLGIVLCYIYEKKGSKLLNFLIHMFFNFFAFVLQILEVSNQI